MTALTPMPFSGADRVSTSEAGSLRGRLSRWLAERRRRARLAHELSQLSDRDLTDLGIGRGDFPAILDGTYRL